MTGPPPFSGASLGMAWDQVSATQDDKDANPAGQPQTNKENDRTGISQMKTIQSFAVAAVLGMAAQVAEAQDTFVGIGVTSDYIVGNMRQNDGKPALQAYFETNLDNGIYFGTWASQVDFSAFGSSDNAEIDLYAGYRGGFGKISYDIAYFRYYYDKSGFDSDEVWLKADYNISEKAKVGTNLRHLFHGIFADEWMYGPSFGLALSEKTALNGSLTFNTLNKDVTWDLALRQQLTDTLSAKATYYDSNSDGGKIAVSLNWDTSINSLFK
jgi:uncharacterized protein (TIGR02001 family)